MSNLLQHPTKWPLTQFVSKLNFYSHIYYKSGQHKCLHWLGQTLNKRLRLQSFNQQVTETHYPYQSNKSLDKKQRDVI